MTILFSFVRVFSGGVKSDMRIVSDLERDKLSPIIKRYYNSCAEGMQLQVQFVAANLCGLYRSWNSRRLFKHDVCYVDDRVSSSVVTYGPLLNRSRTVQES